MTNLEFNHMHVCMPGCAGYAGLRSLVGSEATSYSSAVVYFLVYILVGNYLLVNLFIAVLLRNYNAGGAIKVGPA